MVIQMTVQEIVIFIACIIGFVAGILLVAILWDIKKIVGVFRPVIQKNKAGLQTAIGMIPVIVQNAAQISSDVKETTEKLKVAVPVILEDAQWVAHATKGSIQLATVAVENVGSGILDTVEAYKRAVPSIASYICVVQEIVQIIARMFSREK